MAATWVTRVLFSFKCLVAYTKLLSLLLNVFWLYSGWRVCFTSDSPYCSLLFIWIHHVVMCSAPGQCGNENYKLEMYIAYSPSFCECVMFNGAVRSSLWLHSCFISDIYITGLGLFLISIFWRYSQIIKVSHLLSI